LQNSVTKLLQLVFTKNQNQHLHITATNLLHVAFTKNQNQLLHNTATKSLQLLFTKNQNQILKILRQSWHSYYSQRIKTNILHNTATKLLQLEFTKNQNQMFTQYCDNTVACSIQKESKPNFCTILRQNCCM